MNDSEFFKVNDRGIWRKTRCLDDYVYEQVLPKEVFIEAYNKWIKEEKQDEISN